MEKPMNENYKFCEVDRYCIGHGKHIINVPQVGTFHVCDKHFDVAYKAAEAK